MATNRFLLQAGHRARRILSSPGLSLRLADAVLHRSDKLKARLGDALNDVLLLSQLLKDWALGRYPNVPWATLLTITAALVYFLMPLDAVPDPIVALGLLDDMGVIAGAIGRSQSDLEKYRAWKKEQENNNEL